MFSGLEPGEKLPSAEVASQAVDVAVYGDENRVKVKQSGHRITVSSGDQKGLVRKSLEVAAWIAGIVILFVTVLIYWETIAGWL